MIDIASKPVVTALRWSPTRARISFKNASLTHEVRAYHQPSYRTEVISDYRPMRTLRWSSITLVEEQPFGTSSDRRCFIESGMVSPYYYEVRACHQPSYLTEVISDYRPMRTCRSSSITLVEEQSFGTSSDRRCCIHTAVATLNNLPETIWSIQTLDSFRRMLKKYSFQLSNCD